MLFTSDNGASREGEDTGCSQYFEILSPTQGDIDDDHARLDLLGGPQTLAHYPRGWAMAGNTPFRLYKCNTHAGGHQVAMISSWPERVTDPGGFPPPVPAHHRRAPHPCSTSWGSKPRSSATASR